MPKVSFRLMILLSFFVMGILFHSSGALAVEIKNKSDLQIGVAILRVKGEHKTPLFIKILQPGAAVDSTPEEPGPFLISVKVFDTDETLRMENVKADAVIQYKKGKLKRIRKK